jgi:hypothetical protein
VARRATNWECTPSQSPRSRPASMGSPLDCGGVAGVEGGQGGLERDGLVVRTLYPQVPPRVEYELALPVRRLIELLGALQSWATEHISVILEAQRKYDTARLPSRTVPPADHALGADPDAAWFLSATTSVPHPCGRARAPSYRGVSSDGVERPALASFCRSGNGRAPTTDGGGPVAFG